MKILLYSHAFDPSLGGVESVSRTLAEGFFERGVECKVVTVSPGPGTSFPFEVIRQPDRARIRALVDWADVFLFNGASLAMQPHVALSRKPVAWVHVGYQAASIDGAGWIDGGPSPLTPWANFKFHLRRAGAKSAIKDGAKLALRRFVAHFVVTRNVAITQWMAQKLPLPRQVQIYNPFPIEQFYAAEPVVPDHDFFYMGRLVQEKGVETLIRAFAMVANQGACAPRLLLIGDGTAQPAIEALVDELGVRESVTFTGRKSGAELVAAVGRGRIGVLPSIWFEPMGGVAVELMAAGKPLIVSAQGGLAECVGDAGLTFSNGDADELSACMRRLMNDEALQRDLAARARNRTAAFAPGPLIDQYITLLRGLLPRQQKPRPIANLPEITRPGTL